MSVKIEDMLLVGLHRSVIELTSELLELGYSLSDAARFGLHFIYNQKEKQQLSTDQFVDLECRYMQNIVAMS
ncbi:MAG: hypothetical protein KAH10_03600 [Flavobacteriales bacterium]|nr:hypothetical protein [Flavobacteriales bacterium]